MKQGLHFHPRRMIGRLSPELVSYCTYIAVQSRANRFTLQLLYGRSPLEILLPFSCLVVFAGCTKGCKLSAAVHCRDVTWVRVYKFGRCGLSREGKTCHISCHRRCTSADHVQFHNQLQHSRSEIYE